MEFCQGKSVTLDAGSGYNSYLWSNSETTQTSTVTAGSYNVKVVDANGCDGTSAKVNIVANELPQVFLGADTTICENSILTLNAGVFESYVWNDGSTLQELNVYETGEYTLEVVDIKGCKNSDKIFVTASVCSGITPKDHEKYSILVFPNPTTSSFQLKIDNLKTINNNISILNITGEVVKRVVITREKTIIDISNFNSGIYFINIQVGGNTEIIRLVKQ